MHKQLQVQYHKISTLLGLCIYIFASPSLPSKKRCMYMCDTDFVLLRWTENFKTRIEGREGKCGGRLGNPWISALAPQLNAGGLRKTKKKKRRSKIIAQLPCILAASEARDRFFARVRPAGVGVSFRGWKERPDWAQRAGHVGVPLPEANLLPCLIECWFNLAGSDWAQWRRGKCLIFDGLQHSHERFWHELKSLRYNMAQLCFGLPSLCQNSRIVMLLYVIAYLYHYLIVS